LHAGAVWDSVPQPPESFAPSPEFDFRTGVPDLRQFPFSTWRRLVSNQFRGANADVLTYGDSRGTPDCARRSPGT
jgi:GntR family transcriptional regulator/MocR family aminotransferase